MLTYYSIRTSMTGNSQPHSCPMGTPNIFKMSEEAKISQCFRNPRLSVIQKKKKCPRKDYRKKINLNGESVE